MNKKQGYQGFRKFSIKTRLVIALLLISIIPLAGISGYSFHIFSVALREKLSASISQTLSMINLNMVSEIEKYQYLCGSICISEEIKDGLLNKDMSDIEKNQAINEIQSMIRTKIIYPAQAKNITVYDTDGNIFYDLGYDGFYQNDVDMLLDRLRQENQDVWAYVHTYRDRDILVLGRRIYEQYSESRVIGYTLISIDEKIFSKTVLEPVGLADSSNIMYMNMDGTVLSSWDRNIALGEKVDSEFLKNIQQKLPSRTDSFSIHKDGEEQLVTYIFNKKLNQLFVYTMPYHYINSEVYTMLRRILIVAVILVLTCIGIVAMVYPGITSPIRSMLDFCKELSHGNLDVRIQDNHKDELSDLSGSMNHMADTIQNLLEQQKEQEKKKRELELQMLQYQLNPHFLFNTLNSLRFVAAMHNDQIVSDGIQVDGILRLKVLYIVGNDDMPFYSAETVIPFSHIVEARGISKDSVYYLHSELEQLSTTMADSNELEIRATIGVNVLVLQCSEEFILDKMEEAPLDQEKIRSLPGITVYIVQPEDTLWDIAKRFYTTTEEIRSMNELENEEISSGMPLLLVKKVEE